MASAFPLPLSAALPIGRFPGRRRVGAVAEVADAEFLVGALVAAPDEAGGGAGLDAGRRDGAEDFEGLAGEVGTLELDAAGDELVYKPREVVFWNRAALVYCHAVSRLSSKYLPSRYCSSRGLGM